MGASEAGNYNQREEHCYAALKSSAITSSYCCFTSMHCFFTVLESPLSPPTAVFLTLFVPSPSAVTCRLKNLPNGSSDLLLPWSSGPRIPASLALRPRRHPTLPTASRHFWICHFTSPHPAPFPCSVNWVVVTTYNSYDPANMGSSEGFKEDLLPLLSVITTSIILTGDAKSQEWIAHINNKIFGSLKSIECLHKGLRRNWSVTHHNCLSTLWMLFY